jgi:hypothetical protein
MRLLLRSELNGRDLREQPLVQRRARLQAVLARAKDNVIRFSDAFPDTNALLAECARLGLEGAYERCPRTSDAEDDKCRLENRQRSEREYPRSPSAASVGSP